MARHNIYIRQENEEAWQKSTKSDLVNDLLERLTMGSNSSEFNPYAIESINKKQNITHESSAN